MLARHSLPVDSRLEAGRRTMSLSAKRELWNDPLTRAIFRTFGSGVTLVSADLSDGTTINGGVAPVDSFAASNVAMLCDTSRNSRCILPKPATTRKRR